MSHGIDSSRQPTPNMDSNHPTTSTYASKTKIQPITTFQFPTTEQGIIFPFVPDSKIRDYLEAVSKQVGNPKHILAASRISNNRVAVFLSSENLVDIFFQEQKAVIQIADNSIQGRRMKNKPKKLILSNVSPTINNTTLENHLSNALKLNLASKISLLRVNPGDDVFGHVISYRRQVYAFDVAEDSTPSSFLLHDNETEHRIFISFDEISCFKCKSRTHKAEDCKIFSEETHSNVNNIREQPSHKVNMTLPPLTFVDSPPPDPNAMINIVAHQKINTRPHLIDNDNLTQFSIKTTVDSLNKKSVVMKISPTSSEENNLSSQIDERSIFLSPTDPVREEMDIGTPINKRPLSVSSSESALTIHNPKKGKADNQISTEILPDPSTSDRDSEHESEIDQLLTTADDIFSPLETLFNSDTYPLTLENLVNFLDSCRNNTNQARIIAENFTDDLDSLITILQKARKLIHHRSTKNRMTRILKVLINK